MHKGNNIIKIILLLMTVIITLKSRICLQNWQKHTGVQVTILLT
jgi:hypothetical protein